VGRVEGAKKCIAKRARTTRESPNFGATSDEFATFSENFQESLKKLCDFMNDVAPEV
jgi:hypothetical protein